VRSLRECEDIVFLSMEGNSITLGNPYLICYRLSRTAIVQNDPPNVL